MPKATPPKLVARPKNAPDRAARLRKIMQSLDEMYPNVKVPLLHSNPWELLVATILSAQCTDKRVNEVTPGLFRKYPSISDFAHAGQAELGRDIRSTGFFNNKSKALIGAAQKVLTDFGGQIPQTMKQLLTIPGAARKTANVVLGGAYRVMEGVVVDTHVQRLSRRLDLCASRVSQNVPSASSIPSATQKIRTAEASFCNTKLTKSSFFANPIKLSSTGGWRSVSPAAI
ncbi:MAG: endonuclease III [Bryobacteraceae bacterium]